MANTSNQKVALHVEVLPRATKRALVFLSEQKWLQRSQWYLAGGTALALFEGHRRSVDLDFFFPKSTFDLVDLLRNIEGSNWVADIVREKTVYGRLFGAKISFIAYPFFIPRDAMQYGAVRILRPQDIAVMKIVAISQRGRKRDFIDLYWYVKRHEPLIDVMLRLPEQYPSVAHNYHHIAKSLMYFTDAENDPLPKLFFDVSWKEVKTFFEREVPRVTRQLL